MRFLTLDLKTKLIISESTFRRSLCRMVVYKMLKSKVEIHLAFFLTLILFSLVPIGKEFCTTQNLTAGIKETSVVKTFNSIKNHYENFGYCIREWISAAVI